MESQAPSRTDTMLNSLLANLKKYILAIASIALAVFLAMSSFFTTQLGYTYVVQDTLFGSIRVFSEPGVHFKMPMFSNVYTYNQAMTLSFGNQESGEKIQSSRQLTEVEVQFADTYTARIPATFRFRLSADPEKIIAMHREFRSYDNLIDSLLIKNAKNVTVVTATQYTGEEFFQGGLNKFKVQLEDQLQNGLYETERRQVEVEQTDLAAVSSTNDDGDRLERKVQLVWKNIILQDSAGQAKRIAKNLGLSGSVARELIRFVDRLYASYLAVDASMFEINPVLKTTDEKILAVDAKVNIDDNALFRHPKIEAMRDLSEEDPSEVEAGKNNLNFVKLDGNVGCMVNGAGLAMATMDIIKLSGGEPANFLDVGGSANAKTVEAGLKIILSDSAVKAVLINVFGGIVRCDRVASGVVEAYKNLGDIQVPVIVRLQGTNAEEGKAVIDNSGLKVRSAITLKEAADIVKEVV